MNFGILISENKSGCWYATIVQDNRISFYGRIGGVMNAS